MLTIRLSPDAEKRLKKYCEEQGVTKSMVVKEAIEMYFEQKQKTVNAYEVGKDLFGQVGSEDTDRSVSYKSRLKGKLDEKHAH